MGNTPAKEKTAYRNHGHLSLADQSYYAEVIEFIRILGDTLLQNLNLAKMNSLKFYGI